MRLTRLTRSPWSVRALVFSALTMPISSFAIIPVTDVGAIANLVKSYNQLKSQYDLLHQTYENAQQQLDTAQQLTHDSEGHYGFGGMMNGPGDLKNQQWSPDDWHSTLQGLSGGNPARYQELVNTYKRDHPDLSPSDYQKGASRDQANVYAQDVQVNRAASVNATYSFNNIKTHLTRIHALSEKIDQAKNTKAAMDLNSRLLAEVAYIQTQELKMQILMNQQMAQTKADTIASKTASAKFNTLPDQ